MDKDEVTFICPKCNKQIHNPVIWGCGWDYDLATCEHCGYNGYLNSGTGIDIDGSIYQDVFDDEE